MKTFHDKEYQFGFMGESIYYLHKFINSLNGEEIYFATIKILPLMKELFRTMVDLGLNFKIQNESWYLTKAWDRITLCCKKLKLKKLNSKEFPFVTNAHCRTIELHDQRITEKWITSLRLKFKKCVIVKRIQIRGCDFDDGTFKMVLQCIETNLSQKQV